MFEFQPTTFGDYLLQDRIGTGGMAEIFLATAQGIEGFEKRLVIKRILPALSDDEQFVRMFVEEAKLCVSLHHPNIVQVYDLGLFDGQYYIAMEYVDGRDLLKTLAWCGRKERPVPFPTDIALYIVMEVLKGLQYAHGLTKDGEPLGIIHRDVSPSNVLLSYEGEVKLGDFGIAKARTRERTATGILKGKFGYMAPEQVTGVPIDFKADIFAVGILLYELLTGHRLFAGKNDLAVLERVRKADISPPLRHYRKDLDYELEDIVMKALAREPAHRFASCAQLHDAIHDYVFRAQATVGPGLLASFMQDLFLDSDELARRVRVRLPPIAGVNSSAFGLEDTDDERSISQRMAEVTSEDLETHSAASPTEGRPVSSPPLLADTPGDTSSANRVRDAVQAIRRARQTEGSAAARIVRALDADSSPPSDRRRADRAFGGSTSASNRRGPGAPRRRSQPSAVGVEGVAMGAFEPDYAPDGLNGFSPSEIVERARRTSEDETETESITADVEPTTRADSDFDLPSLELRQLSAQESTQTTAPPGPHLDPAAESPTGKMQSEAAQPGRRHPSAPRALEDDVFDQTPSRRAQSEVTERASASRDRPPTPLIDTEFDREDGSLDGFAAPDDSTPYDPIIPDPADQTFAETPLAERDFSELGTKRRAVRSSTRAEPIDDGPTPSSEAPTRLNADRSTPPLSTRKSDPLFGPGIADEATIQGTFEDRADDGIDAPLVAALSEAADVERKSAPRLDAPPTSVSVELEAPLYGDDDASSTADVPFEGEEEEAREPSVPAITNEGRLADAGASGLFGALSALDEAYELDFEADERDADETEIHPHTEDGEPVNGVDAAIAEAKILRRSSDARARAEYGDTRMGALADPIDANLPNFALDQEEATESAFESRDLLGSVGPRNGKGLDDDGPDSERLAAARPSSLGIQIDVEPIDEGFFTVSDDPIAQAASPPSVDRDPSAAPTENEQPVGPLKSEPFFADEDEGPRTSGLVSDSFELELEVSDIDPTAMGVGAETRADADPRGDDDVGPPVHPVSMVKAPGGVEPTDSRLAGPVSGGAFGPPGGPAALRAAVGRAGRIRELNRTHRSAERPTADRVTPAEVDETPLLPSVAPGPRPYRGGRSPESRRPEARSRAASPVSGASSAAARPSASPAAALWGDGTPSAPPAMVVHRPRSRWLTAAVYGLPLLAVLLTVAALVSSIVLPSRSPIPPGEYGRIIRVPDDTPLEAPRRPAFANDGLVSTNGAPKGPDAAEAPPSPEAANPPNASELAPAPIPLPEPALDEADLGLIRVRCAQPTIVRIVGVGSYRAAPVVARRIEPGEYEVKLSRNGELRNKVTVEVTAGRTVRLPCP